MFVYIFLLLPAFGHDTNNKILCQYLLITDSLNTMYKKEHIV